MTVSCHFPFGAPLLPRVASRAAPSEVFVLGAYPSAVHVSWRPPGGNNWLTIAVNNEPTPFWTADADDNSLLSDASQFEQWCKLVSPNGALPREWGSFKRGRSSNGTSGRWVRDRVLRRLGRDSARACLSDCLDHYCWKFGSATSRGQGGLVDEEYAPRAKRGGWPVVRIPERPSPALLVQQALDVHRTRLEKEIDRAAAPEVVTLGAEPYLVLRGLFPPKEAEKVPAQLPLTPELYGKPLIVLLRGRRVKWWPLIHPGNHNPPHQRMHDNWRGDG